MAPPPASLVRQRDDATGQSTRAGGKEVALACALIDLVAFPESYRRLLCFPGVFLADACLLAYFLLAKLTGGGRAGPADGDGRRRKAGSHLHACGRVADSSIPNCQGKERVVGSNGVEKECPRSIA